MEDFDLQSCPLPFSAQKQDAVIGHFLCDEKLFATARTLVAAEHLQDVWTSKVWLAALDFANRFGRMPSDAELRESQPVVRMEKGERARLLAKLTQIAQARTQYGQDVLRVELDNWLHGALYRKGVEESAKLFHKGKFKDAFSVARRSFQDIDRVSFTESGEMEFGDPLTFLQDQQRGIERALTFGIEGVDKLLLKVGEGGSLLPGDTTAILAPVNIGKTSVMITTAIANVEKGKSVLFFSHEGRPSDIQEKMWRCLLKVDRGTFYQMAQTELGRKKLAHARAFLARFMTYVPMNHPSLTVEELEATILRYQDRRVSKYGKGYDLIVDDYLAKLKTGENSKGNMAPRQSIAYVYDYFCRLMTVLDIHGLTAVQANREGSKINRGTKGAEQRLLTLEDVAEAFGVPQVVANLLTWNRGPDDVKAHRGTFWLGKSRSEEVDWAICCRTDFARARTHSNDLGCTVYRGAGLLGADELNTLLNGPG